MQLQDSAFAANPAFADENPTVPGIRMGTRKTLPGLTRRPGHGQNEKELLKDDKPHHKPKYPPKPATAY